MSMRFRLRKTSLEDGTISFHPRIPATLFHSGKSKQVVAVLDTGSDLIYIPKDIAEYFGLETSGKTFMARMPEGEMEYWVSRIQIEVSKGHESLRDTFKAVVPVKAGLNEIIFGVPFLSRFSVTFDYANEQIILKKTAKRSGGKF